MFGGKFLTLYFCLVTLLVTLQEQVFSPSHLGKLLTGELMRENFIYKFVCQRLKPFSRSPSNQLSFKILVFLFCRHKVKYNCCKFLFLFLKIELFISMFVEQGVAKA